MRFWDSSALVPLVVAEPQSKTAAELLAADPEAVVWWASAVECASAIARRARAGGDERAGAQAYADLAELAGGWIEVPPGPRVRELAIRLLRVHDLRSADALQLAAALVAAEEQPATLELVTLDERLAAAGRREGFPVLPDET